MKSTIAAGAGGRESTGEQPEIESLYERLQRVPDRRGRRGRRHEAATVLTLLALAKMAGEKTMNGVAHWVRLRGAWLQEVLPLHNQWLPWEIPISTPVNGWTWRVSRRRWQRSKRM